MLKGKMEEKNLIYMKKGVDENSYFQNTLLTKKINSVTKFLIGSAVDSIFSNSLHGNGILKTADLGCATGPNTFTFILTVREHVSKKCLELNCQQPELVFYLSDLPSNDFNSLFNGLPEIDNEEEEKSCFFMGVPGSFHSWLFPRNSLHFVHSSFSLHWLSQAPKGLTSNEGSPLNKGKINASKTSPTIVREAYLAQFQQDFTNFLKSRSEEVVSKGFMVLTLHGCLSLDNYPSDRIDVFETLAEAISKLVEQGLIDENKLDSFNVPYFTPRQFEVQQLIEKEDSFIVQNIETKLITFFRKQAYDLEAGVKKYTNNVRSYTESVISNQFGKQVVDKIYDTFAEINASHWDDADTIGAETIIVFLQKK